MDIIKGLFAKLWEDFSWFILGLLAIGVIWFFNGGYNNPSAHNGAYIKPLAPLDSGETYGNYYAGTPTTAKETLNLPDSPATIIRKTEQAVQAILAATKSAPPITLTSPLAKSIFFDGVAGAKSGDPNSEYIRILASDKITGSINVSGLALEGVYFDGDILIPRAGDTQNILLSTGDRAILSTGISPTGSSFRVNVCSSYLSGASKLVPALRQSAFTASMTYAQCIAAHKDDTGFDSHEWRVFLGQKVELWGNSADSIKLVDQNKKVVDVLNY